jgi:hypothetical protein
MAKRLPGEHEAIEGAGVATATAAGLLSSDLERCGAVVIFRDATGTRWLRRPDGDLQEQP